MTLLAAFQTLLHRYSGQEDILIGSPIAGRNHAETENLIGFFVSTLPLRAQLRGDLAFTELLQQVKDVCLGASAHQDVPFEKLVEELQPERDLNRSPLLEVIFLLNNQSDPTRKLPSLYQEPTDTLVRFDLTLSVTDYQTNLAGTWHYRTSLFERSTIEKFRDNFATLLQSITRNPNGRLSTFEILTASEKESSLLKKQARDEHRMQRLKALKRSV
jgi:non-ribosomal peptide synthetase component F